MTIRELVKNREWNKLWDKVSVWVVVSMAIIIAAVVGYAGYSQMEASSSSALAAQYGQENYDLLIQNQQSQATVKKLIKEVLAAQADHSKTLNQVATLQFEVGVELASLPMKEDYIKTLVIALITDVNHLCGQVAGCVPLPIPAS